MINQFTGGLEFRRLKKAEIHDEEFSDVNAGFCPVQSTLSIDEKIKLVKEVGEEIIKEEELRALFERKEMPICYDGFEPNDRMHIGQCLLRAMTVNRLTKAGCVFIFWIGDWFAQINNKMGGDIEKIQVVGRYFIEMWRATGMDLKNVKFVWCGDEINKHNNEYWQSVINVARSYNVGRIKRCCPVLGRKEGDSIPASQIIYPCMQCTDIFFLKSDIISHRMDQRKVNMLGREYCNDVKITNKPIIVSHHLLRSLSKDVEIMTKNIPDSAIFMEDSSQEVERKIKKAYCPEKQIDDNPIFEYIKYLIIPKYGKFELKRPEKYGGDKIYNTYDEICEDYKKGDLNPGDLKPNVIRFINDMLDPVRKHFEKDLEAQKILKLVKQLRATH